MSINHIIIVTTEPKSIFLEILFKYFKSKKNILQRKKITLIGNLPHIIKEARKNNYKKKFNQVYDISESKKKIINIINIKANNILRLKDCNSYISNSFQKSISILKNNKNVAMLNGPINKKSFLKRKFLGITEYLAKKTNSNYPVMLIYNKKISVSPITTHLPIKYVSRNISKNKILNNIKSINNFYKKNLKFKPNFALLGLNPHCESSDKFSEEQKIIIPAIKQLNKSQISVKGPFSADTFFIKKNLDKYDVVIGMYHDQVLTPLKTLFNFNAINITIGLPFVRVSPDHGPNSAMYGNGKSDPASIYCAMEFLNKI